MFKIDSDLAIHLNRGDAGTLSVSGNNETYEFENGDRVKFNIYEQKGYNKKPLYSKEVTVQGIIHTYDEYGEVTGTYRKLDYIYNTYGNAWINTGLTYSTDNHLLKFDICAERIYSEATHDDDFQNEGFFGTNDSTGGFEPWYISFQNHNQRNNITFKPAMGNAVTIRSDWNKHNYGYEIEYNAQTGYHGYFTFDGERIVENDEYKLYIPPSASLKLGGGSFNNWFSSFRGKIYYAKIYKATGNTPGTGAYTPLLVRDYIPVINLTNSANTIGLLDLVNGVFYSSAGNGTYKAPPYSDDDTHVNIALDESATDFVPEINKKKTYWYDITLNEDTTIIGYEDADGEHPGAKLFNVYPAKTSFDDE